MNEQLLAQIINGMRMNQPQGAVGNVSNNELARFVADPMNNTDAINAMRAANNTGGAVGNVSDREASFFNMMAGNAMTGANMGGNVGNVSDNEAASQPGKVFADEISDRLKVIACIEKPNMVHSESFNQREIRINYNDIKKLLEAGDDDAQIIFWGPQADIPTGLETIEERCKLAFDGVPRETRKSFEDGTTIFERVLPGADRMYPDTDSAPIPLADDYIESLKENLPIPVYERQIQMTEWGIPMDAHKYLLKNNLLPLIDRICNNLGYTQKYIGTFLGHFYKHLEGQKDPHPEFSNSKIYGLFSFMNKNKLDPELAKYMLWILFDHPNMEFNSVLTSLNFRRQKKETLLAPVGFLIEKFREIKISKEEGNIHKWLMGQLRRQAVGNIPLNEFSKLIEEEIRNYNHTSLDNYPD